MGTFFETRIDSRERRDAHSKNKASGDPQFCVLARIRRPEDPLCRFFAETEEILRRFDAPFQVHQEVKDQKRAKYHDGRPDVEPLPLTPRQTEECFAASLPAVSAMSVLLRDAGISVYVRGFGAGCPSGAFRLFRRGVWCIGCVGDIGSIWRNCRSGGCGRRRRHGASHVCGFVFRPDPDDDAADEADEHQDEDQKVDPVIRGVSGHFFKLLS